MEFDKKLKGTLKRCYDNLLREYEYLSKFSEEHNGDLNYYIDLDDEGINLKIEVQEIENELFAILQKLENLKSKI